MASKKVAVHLLKMREQKYLELKHTRVKYLLFIAVVVRYISSNFTK